MSEPIKISQLKAGDEFYTAVGGSRRVISTQRRGVGMVWIEYKSLASNRVGRDYYFATAEATLLYRAERVGAR